MTKEKNILSLFDGISCGRVALERSGMSVGAYYASEIDKYATTVSENNYPDIIRLGDVTKWEDWDIDFSSIDIVFAGFPCQSWSLSGNQLGDKDPRGMLFWTTLNIISRVLELNPDAKFIMENVRMKNEFEKYITLHTEEALGKVNKYLINSSLVSAQNRNRFYWTNIPNIQQPEDKGIMLKDIIVDGAVDCRMTTKDKAYALTVSYNRAVVWNSIERKQRTMILEAINDNKVHIDLFKEPPYSFYETRTEAGKIERRRIRLETGTDSTPRSKEFKMYVPLNNGKGNCLVTVESPLDFLVDTSWSYRKLYPLECERLQTLPDGYTEGVSNTQRFKMLGNGWTVDVVAHILKYMND